MSNNTLSLTPIEAAYVIGALRIALDHIGDSLTARDREIMHAVMIRLAAPLDLSDDAKSRIEGGQP